MQLPMKKWLTYLIYSTNEDVLSMYYPLGNREIAVNDTDQNPVLKDFTHC